MADACKRGLLHLEKEIVTYAATQMKLEGIVGGEINQPQKGMSCVFHIDDTAKR